MDSSASSSRHIHEARRPVEDALNQLDRQTQFFNTKVSTLRDFIGLCRMPRSSILAKFDSLCQPSAPSSAKRPSLIDNSIADIESSFQHDDVMLDKFVVAMKQYHEGKKKHALELEEILDRIRKDDISTLLIGNKGSEEQVIANEIGKYNSLESGFLATLQKLEEFVKLLIGDFQAFVSTSKILNQIDKEESKQTTVSLDWQQKIQSYFEIQSTLENQGRDIAATQSKCITLRNDSIHFVNQRRAESQSLISRIESTQAEDSQRALRAQLDRLSVNSYSSALPTPSATNNGSFGQPPHTYSSFPANSYTLPQPSSTTQYPAMPPAATYSQLPGNALPPPSLYQQPPRTAPLPSEALHALPGQASLPSQYAQPPRPVDPYGVLDQRFIYF
jgi:hypothetical protein